MTFARFPHETQFCTIDMESCKYDLLKTPYYDVWLEWNSFQLTYNDGLIKAKFMYSEVDFLRIVK